MKKILGTIFLSLLLVSPVNAEWTFVTKLSDNSSKIYIDLDTFKRDGDQIYIWKLSDLTVPYKSTKSSAL